jgi:hypothetical protein
MYPSSTLGRYLRPDGAPIRLPVPPSRFQLQQCGKPPTSADQLCWWTYFHDLTRLHHQDPIGFLGRGQAMRHGEYRAAAVKDLIESKAIRRGLSLKIFDWGRIEQAGGNKVRQRIGLRRGLGDDLARKLSKLIRDEFPKAKPQIQGDAVRVSGKSKDELQRVIARLRELDEPVPLQFQNYR